MTISRAQAVLPTTTISRCLRSLQPIFVIAPVDMVLSTGAPAVDDQLMLMTQQGKILRTRVNDTRAIGRNTQGVRLIRIDEADRVVSVARFAEKDEGGAPSPDTIIDETPGANTPESPAE